MIGKNWKIIDNYKNMLIYEKDNCIYFGNKIYTNARAKNITSAKNLITRHINKLTAREKRRYLKY